MSNHVKVNRTYFIKPTHNHTPHRNDIQAVGKFEFIFKQELKKVKDNEEERANK